MLLIRFRLTFGPSPPAATMIRPPARHAQTPVRTGASEKLSAHLRRVAYNAARPPSTLRQLTDKAEGLQMRTTFDVGNEAEGVVLAHYVRAGLRVCIPFGTGGPYDLAVDAGTRLL